jgi:hypothetical protein
MSPYYTVFDDAAAPLLLPDTNHKASAIRIASVLLSTWAQFFAKIPHFPMQTTNGYVDIRRLAQGLSDHIAIADEEFMELFMQT